ncbi:MAG: alanine--tRNA ligase [Desulfobacteraceae bacterium]|nr:MAG: alanine--tRNA ligase [Desulfobacteraceae bacterium]
MNFREIRSSYLEYFKRQGHEIVGSSSLIPRDDPTLLFTNAGMVQFKNLFLGQEKRGYTRAATSQKCVRAGGKHNDLENVGYTARHHTFFEMLGNFSFGDYFKKEAIRWAWELLTEIYRLPADRLWVSVYLEDDEAHGIWEKEIGIPAARIVRLGEKDNFWAMGETGPCGPCSEILIDQGESVGCGKPTCGPGCDCDRYLEIWNLVFTQFDRDIQGNLHPLPKPNIDTGMGLERISAVVQGVLSNYSTDLFKGIIGRIEELSEKEYGKESKQDVSFRVIADHSRAAAFLIGDGVMPSNEGRGYVLRRIIRRAIRFGQLLGLKDPFMHKVASKVIDVMGQDYGELVASRQFIEGLVLNEEKRFADTLHFGMKMFQDSLAELREKNVTTIPGELVFKLYDTYGLSPDLLEDIAREEGLRVDLDSYEKAMSRQRTQSQEAWKGSGEEEIPEVYRKLTSKGIATRFTGYEQCSARSKIMAIIRSNLEISSAEAGEEVEVVLEETPFYGAAGGQVGDTGRLTRDSGARMIVKETLRLGHDLIIHLGRIEEGRFGTGDRVEARVDEERRRAIALNHTATHLLHAALREILGGHVKQAGSYVGPERFRFDFSHFTQVGAETLREVENLVNAYVRENHSLTVQELARDEAMKTGAMAIFEERYGEKVRVVSVGEGVSKELCGGTHTEKTGDVGIFKILSESAVGANVRRIEALTGGAALEYVQRLEDEVGRAAALLKSTPDQLKERVERLLKDYRQKEREVEFLKGKLLSSQTGDLLAGTREINGVQVLVKEVGVDSPKDLREMADQIRSRFDSGILVLGSKANEKAMLLCVVSKDLAGRYKAGEIVSRLSQILGGRGGGRADMAQGGGPRPEDLGRALESVYDLVARL